MHFSNSAHVPITVYVQGLRTASMTAALPRVSAHIRLCHYLVTSIKQTTCANGNIICT